MRESEYPQIILAIIILTIVAGFEPLIKSKYIEFLVIFISAIVIISVNIFSKKFMAHQLDSNVEHKIWHFQRFGLKPNRKLKKPIRAGAIFPLFFTIISLGIIKVMTIMTYKTKALKRRAARRFGTFSFTEMTDFHNALVGAAGIVSLLFLSFLAYFIPGSGALSKLTAYYVFWNMLPFSNFDGMQIFIGSRVLWSTLEIIAVIFTSYALFLV
tara:strand:- start:234 stop:872 length:639 start_codon:yes stop_codon:yes gene_type:complete